MSPLLDVRGLTASYGRAQVLFDVALELAAGEVVALIGRNGAGKTTTLKAIMGLVTARADRLTFKGRSIVGQPTYRIARLGLGYVAEDRRIFTDLTVEENLEVGRQAARTGRSPWTRERLFALFPNLAEMRGRRGGQMSGGEQQMLAIARTLMGNPDGHRPDHGGGDPGHEAGGRGGPSLGAELGLRGRHRRPRLRHRARRHPVHRADGGFSRRRGPPGRDAWRLTSRRH
jgi:ABC-type uncharacterized transport system ATPase subunit